MGFVKRDEAAMTSAQTAARTWEISDLDGANKRTVTLAQFKAEVATARAKALAKFVSDADAAGLTGPLVDRARAGLR